MIIDDSHSKFIDFVYFSYTVAYTLNFVWVSKLLDCLYNSDNEGCECGNLGYWGCLQTNTKALLLHTLFHY